MQTTKRNLVFFCVLVLLLDGCIHFPAKCSIYSLLLDKSLLPNGTYVEPLVSPIPDKPEESAEQGFYYAPDHVIYEVIRWNSVSAAKYEYVSVLRSAFDVDKYMGPWETPSELIYTSPIADNYYLACGIDQYEYQCRMIATYNEYSVYLKAGISQQGITYSTVGKILQVIDEQMARCTNSLGFMP